MFPFCDVFLNVSIFKNASFVVSLRSEFYCMDDVNKHGEDLLDNRLKLDCLYHKSRDPSHSVPSLYSQERFFLIFCDGTSCYLCSAKFWHPHIKGELQQRSKRGLTQRLQSFFFFFLLSPLTVLIVDLLSSHANGFWINCLVSDL